MIFPVSYYTDDFHHISDLGYVYKVVQWHDEEGQSHSSLLDIYEVTQGLPIRAMEISREVSNKKILVFFFLLFFLLLLPLALYVLLKKLILKQ